MVRTYRRKSNRQQWSKEAMELAVEAVIGKEMGISKASNHFQVPHTTLQDYVARKKTDAGFVVEKRLGRFKTVFSQQQEDELVSYLMSMEGHLFGLTMHEFREVAFQLAEKNGIQHPFSEDNLAGKDWMRNFMKRHPGLSLRVPEATSAARAMGFNKVVVKKFFDLLINVIENNNITGDRIFNVDETGFTVNPKGYTKVIAQKGRRQVGAVASAERGETVTAEMCFSAAGTSINGIMSYFAINHYLPLSSCLLFPCRCLRATNAHFPAQENESSV